MQCTLLGNRTTKKDNATSLAVYYVCRCIFKIDEGIVQFTNQLYRKTELNAQWFNIYIYNARIYHMHVKHVRYPRSAKNH